MHSPLVQSFAAAQPLPSAQGPQTPPQSTSVSSPFLAPSLHVGAGPDVVVVVVEVVVPPPAVSDEPELPHPSAVAAEATTSRSTQRSLITSSDPLRARALPLAPSGRARPRIVAARGAAVNDGAPVLSAKTTKPRLA
jgi:hypothetical protein